MKKYFTLLAFIFISITAYGQKPQYNTTDGFMANGYDVVSYFDNNPKEGKLEFVHIHDSINYKFYNAANLEIFKSNPNKYIPQYGGWCAYAVGAKNKKYMISPESYEIKDGKLYLFYKATLKKWIKNGAQELQLKADKNWGILKNE